MELQESVKDEKAWNKMVRAYAEEEQEEKQEYQPQQTYVTATLLEQLEDCWQTQHPV